MPQSPFWGLRPWSSPPSTLPFQRLPSISQQPNRGKRPHHTGPTSGLLLIDVWYRDSPLVVFDGAQTRCTSGEVQTF